VRIGFLGPCDDEALLREATTFLLGTLEVDQAVYLGDAAFLERVTTRWASELGVGTSDAFLARARDAALSGTAEAIEQLLREDALTARVMQVRKLPPAPARAVELVDDRVVLIVHDKAVLDEEDIANASLIVYGQAKEANVRRFGKRSFFTPGPLAERRVGVVEATDDGVFAIVHGLDGTTLLREPLTGGSTKMTVTG
jgi:hypothetical protein